MMMNRRRLLQAAAIGAALPGAGAHAASGPVTADWASLAANYRYPDWFRDAKFGLWSHWGPQAVPEYGDWYGRQMYIQGNPFYDHHLKHYGHPSRTGYMEFTNKWTAANWDPAAMVDLFKAAGAKYIVSLANHHDNFDAFDSRHQRWNSVNVGPRRDVVGTWAKAVRAAGLRFGVSNHSAHAWHWWQAAYGYDPEGPLRGVRYDAYRLTRAGGRDLWWYGLDPQQLYTGPTAIPPDGITSVAAMDAWHEANDGRWLEATTINPAFQRQWLLRQIDLVEKYRPDLVYLDDYALPFGGIGLAAAAHYYNHSIARTGHTDVVMTAKQLTPYQQRGLVEDVERGAIDHLSLLPWQTCTCIGSWFYDRPLYERRGYKPARAVVQQLCDVVAKNGNLLLSIPQRGDGSIDDQELQILHDLAAWMTVNGEAIFGSRPWRRYGEGPTRAATGMKSEGQAAPFKPRDVRFTVAGGRLYAAFLEWPTGRATIASLGLDAAPQLQVGRVTLLGGAPLAFVRDAAGLHVTLPPATPGAFVPVLRIEGERLV